MSDERVRKLIVLADEFDVSLSNAEAQSLLLHLKNLSIKNRAVNLTRIVEEDSALVLHVLDSLLFLKEITDRKDASKLLDVGTGGGYPGIPLAITTNYYVVLLDSVKKKVDACSDFIAKLGIGDRVDAIHDRVESFTLQQREAFDYVVGRAVGSCELMIEYGSPLLKLEGKLILSKGRLSNKEFDDALIVAKICGLRNVSRETYDLPDEYGHREVLVFEKIGKSEYYYREKLEWQCGGLFRKSTAKEIIVTNCSQQVFSSKD